MTNPKAEQRVSNDAHVVFIENDRLRLGVDLSLGGAVTHLAEHGHPNLINSFDWGRQVQMSFYSGPNPFEPAGSTVYESWKYLGWNPIQSGDCFGHRSKILDHRCENGEIYVKCIPMHWPMDNYPGECTFETWYRLKENRVEVTSRLNNHRPDHTQYDARNQELPAVYTNGPWYKLVSYIGSEPFTDGEVTALCTKENGLGWPWIFYRPTEHWAALVDDDGYGLGVYNGMTTEFCGGFFGEKGEGGPTDANTGYISPVLFEVLDHHITFDYHYALIVGSVEEIRRTAAELHASDERSEYVFTANRCDFYYRGIRDAGFPSCGCLDFDFAPGGALIAPHIFKPAGSVRSIRFDAAFTGEGEIPASLTLTFYHGGADLQSCTKSEKQIPLVLHGDGMRRIYTADLGEYDGGLIEFQLAFNGTGHAMVYAVRLVQ